MLLASLKKIQKRFCWKSDKGNRLPPREYSDVWCSIKKINPGAVEPFDPKDVIIDEANRKIKVLQAKVEDLEAKEQRRVSKQASRRRSKPTKRLVQGGEVEDTQTKKQKEAGAAVLQLRQPNTDLKVHIQRPRVQKHQNDNNMLQTKTKRNIWGKFQL